MAKRKSKNKPGTKPIPLPPAIQAYVDRHPDWRRHVDLLILPPTADEALGEWPELAGDRLLAEGDWPTTFGVTRLTLYVKQRREKKAHHFAKMVASQKGPALMTDSVFFAGMPTLQKQFVTDEQLKKVVAIARRHGYNPGIHDQYMPELARFQGDPQAFVPPTGGRNHIRRLCESRGWECHGAVETKHRQPEKDPHETGIRLAPDLIRDNIRRMVERDPTLKKRSRRELVGLALERHGPSGS